VPSSAAGERNGATLLITGHMGSGKSVLGGAIHSPPDVVILDGLRAFAAVDLRYARHLRGLRPTGKRRVFREAGAARGFAEYLVRLRLATPPTRKVNVGNVRRALAGVFPDAAVVGDAANSYLHHVERLGRHTIVKQVVVYRDGRDVAAEMKQRVGGIWRQVAQSDDPPSWFRSIATPGAAAAHWGESIARMEAHADQVRMVRYEDLIADPADVLNPLAEWLGIEAPSWADDYFRSDGIGVHRGILTDSEISDVEEVAGPTLARLGYR